jgi:hypothetical protein
MLSKVLKRDFKNLVFALGILFGAALLIPTLVYISTINSTAGVQDVARGLCVGIIPISVWIVTLVILIKNLEDDLIGKNAYLIHTLPVKVKTLLFSKTVFYFIFTIISILIVSLSACLSFMDFSPYADIWKFMNDNLLVQVDKPDEYVLIAVMIFRILLSNVSLFGFACSIVAFSHLFGTKKALGEFIFIVVGVLLMVLYTFATGGAIRFDSNNNLDTVFFYADTFVSIAVTAGFFIFTNWIFKKKINVL